MEKPEEMIESYLNNKLSSAEKIDFEKKLAEDKNLKEQTDFQSTIIESIKLARKSELKSMLSKVVIQQPQGFFNSTRIAASLVVLSASIALFLWLSNKKEEPVKLDQVSNTIGIDQKPLKTDGTIKKSEAAEVAAVPTEQNSEPKYNNQLANKQPKVITEDGSKEINRKPLQIIDPSIDIENKDTSESEEVVNGRKLPASAVTILVETESFNKKYKFHYKFHKGKLILYGSFDKSLYEILEINGENKNVFLFYKGLYYMLDENQTTVKLLEPIQDKLLVEKLTAYRLSKK